MILLIFVSIIVLILSAFASGSEAALISVTYSKARAMAAAGRRGSRALLKIKNDMRRAISTIVIINNVSNIVGSAVIGVIAGKLFNSTILGIFFAVFTILIIIFSEIIPKTLGEAHAEKISLFVAPEILLLQKLFRPLVWLIEKVVRLFHKGPRIHTVSEAEIKVMAQVGTEAGVIETDESKLIQRIFKLNDITAEDMMTPRQQVESISGDETLGVMRERILKLRHSRIPVYGEDLDTVLGIVLLKDLLMAIAKDQFASKSLDYLQEPQYVRDDMLADDLLLLFQKKEKHLAIVVDENRKMVGIVTLEDVLEELVGEITDEKDVQPDAIKRVSKEEILVDEATEISDINDFFNCLIESDGTMGDYILDKFGKKLKVGEVFKEDELEFKIVSMARVRPKLIGIRKRVLQ